MALRKSTKISSADYTHRYDFLPCYVRGAARWDKTPVQWEFRAGGNGTITKPDGEEIYLGCVWCKANFGKDRDK